MSCAIVETSPSAIPRLTFTSRRWYRLVPKETVSDSLAIDPAPTATDLAALASTLLFAPSAVVSTAAAREPAPSAKELSAPFSTSAPLPRATEFLPLALAYAPTAVPPSCSTLACAESPMATPKAPDLAASLRLSLPILRNIPALSIALTRSLVANNWPPFTASVLAAELISPAATPDTRAPSMSTSRRSALNLTTPSRSGSKLSKSVRSASNSTRLSAIRPS
ncbi:hypothetical protein D3C71_1467920 [compost metagenome]